MSSQRQEMEKEFPKSSQEALHLKWEDESTEMYHFPKSFEDEHRKERKRARRRRRKEMMLKPCKKEQTHPATFPVLVERSKASPSSRHRARIYFSPDFSSVHGAYESADNSDNEEYHGTRAKLPAPNSVGECSHQTRTRKKKKATKVEEELSHSIYPSYLERPPSRNGVNFAHALDTPNRSMDPLSARKSMESMMGTDRPDIKIRFQKPNKLPPIDKENRFVPDDYPFTRKRY